MIAKAVGGIPSKNGFGKVGGNLDDVMLDEDWFYEEGFSSQAEWRRGGEPTTATPASLAVSNGEENEDRLGQFDCSLWLRASSRHAPFKPPPAPPAASADGPVARWLESVVVGWRSVGGDGYVRVLRDRHSHRTRLVFRTHAVRRVHLNANLSDTDIWLSESDEGVAEEAEAATADTCCSFFSIAGVRDPDDASIPRPSDIGFSFRSKTDAQRFTSLWHQSHSPPPA